MAPGFCVLSDFADRHYKVRWFYDHADEGGLIWNDPNIGVRWPIDSPIVTAPIPPCGTLPGKASHISQALPKNETRQFYVSARSSAE